MPVQVLRPKLHAVAQQRYHIAATFTSIARLARLLTAATTKDLAAWRPHTKFKSTEKLALRSDYCLGEPTTASTLVTTFSRSPNG